MKFLAVILLLVSIVGSHSSAEQRPEIVPPKLDSPHIELRLPEVPTKDFVAGGGRFVMLQFDQVGLVGAFDVNKLRITHYFSASEHTPFAAGLTKYVEFNRRKKKLLLYDLVTKELLSEIPVDVDDASSQHPFLQLQPQILMGGSATDLGLLVPRSHGSICVCHRIERTASHAGSELTLKHRLGTGVFLYTVSGVSSFAERMPVENGPFPQSR